MRKILYRIAFHHSGQPRKWLFFVLFKKDMVARSALRRIVHKKGGQMRPHFMDWIPKDKGGSQGGDGQVNASQGIVEHPLDLRPQELILSKLAPLEETAANWRWRPAPASLLSLDDLMAKLTPATSRLLIALSHDNYTQVPGGVQLCLQREQALATEQGATYLQAHPYHALPRLAHVAEEPDTIVSLLLNGAALGDCRMSTLIDATKTIAPTSAQTRVIIHHLMGQLPEQVAELVRAAGEAPAIFWLHDFFSLCPSYALQRNDVAFCGAPNVSSNACMLCVYGQERGSHLQRMQTLFEAVKMDIAAPSAVTAEFWQAKTNLPHGALTVVPHMELTEIAKTPSATRPADRPVTVAFWGSLAALKGWAEFQSLMRAHQDQGTYRFVVMSKEEPKQGEDAWLSVHVTTANPTAMSDAVAHEDVDFVLHWTTARETFSFTTFEALAGSAYVITHRNSGNVARIVAQTGRGAILDDLQDLEAFFTDGRAKSLADTRRAAAQAVSVSARYSEMSLPLIGRND